MYMQYVKLLISLSNFQLNIGKYLYDANSFVVATTFPYVNLCFLL